MDSIRSFLALVPPIEVILTWFQGDSGTETECPTAATCRALFGGAYHHIRLAPKEEGTAAADRARLAFLEGVFKPRTTLSLAQFLDVERHPFVRKSLAALLSFVKDHNASFLTALPHHAMWSADTACLLGNAALHQLGLIPRETNHESLLHWIEKGVTTTMGRRLLTERCMKPTADVAVLEDRQERCALLRVDVKRRDAFVAELKGVYDLPRLFRRFQLGSAGTADLVPLARSYERIGKVLALADGTATALKDHVAALLARWDVDRVIASHAVVSDKIAVGTTHPWRRGIHRDLDAWEDQWVLLYKDMMTTKRDWDELLGDTDAVQWSLKDDAPFTFTTTAKRGRTIATRYSTVVLEARGSSSTVVLRSPAIVAANAAALIVRTAWRRRAVDLWSAEWTAWCETHTATGLLADLVEVVATTDVDCGLAAVADLYGYVRPTYLPYDDKEGGGVEIVGLRHPIVERVHTTAPYVSHSLSFGRFASDAKGDRDNKAQTPCGLLLYGVNAAGKSSLGKALGLSVLMAQLGMPVPATSMRLVPYTGVFTRILGNDNLWAGMSSFVVEMTELRTILNYADHRSLVIGDELCAGTETDSAVALVSAGIQVLERRGVHFLFATHLHELGDAKETTTKTRAYHLSVKAVGSSLQYDRLLKEGSGSAMYGLEVCRGLDMDAEFLALAFHIRKTRCGEPGGKPSRYNALVTVSSCSLCGSTDGLETHHIVPQATSVAGLIGPGVSKNVVTNLAVLCVSCHDKHHRGVLEIKGWKDTTEGRRLC